MNNLLLISMVIMAIINFIFFVMFERSKPQPKDILPIVVICCGASLGRIIFNVIPQVQPVTALVIIAGSVYGCCKGYVTGALCALVSNLFLGQGPWTLFQMTAWGMVGLVAGAMAKIITNFSEKKKICIFAIYGFFAAFLFSLITDFSTIAYMGEGITFISVLAVYGAGLAFNISHGVFNCVLLFFLYRGISRKLYRVRSKTM